MEILKYGSIERGVQNEGDRKQGARELKCKNGKIEGWKHGKAKLKRGQSRARQGVIASKAR
jgi:hypothetical protein